MYGKDSVPIAKPTIRTNQSKPTNQQLKVHLAYVRRKRTRSYFIRQVVANGGGAAV